MLIFVVGGVRNRYILCSTEVKRVSNCMAF